MNRYLCKVCKKQFQSKKKPQRLNLKIFKQYLFGKQTLKQLSIESELSLPTLRKYLDALDIPVFNPVPRVIVLVLDALYFGEKKDQNGLLVCKDYLTKEIVYYNFIHTETKLVYQEAKQKLEQKGFTILAVVADGRIGIKPVFKGIPLQMCQFHQIQIVNRYLTKKPKLEPAIRLKEIMGKLTKSSEKEFKILIDKWLEDYQYFLDEQTTNPITGRKIYTHKRLRSAVYSLIRNMEHLFTYQNHPELNIPNTTNSLEGWFSHLRKLLNCHTGLRKDRRNKLIEYILMESVAKIKKSTLK